MIVLPMAGLSSRFFKAGYDVPKYMLDLHGVPVFDHALGSFVAYFDSVDFLIICRDVYETPEFVRIRCAAMGLPASRLNIVVLDGETAGQAQTVAEGLRRIAVPEDTPLTIFNIDTFRPGFDFPTTFDPVFVDGYLEVFEGKGDHWSFARAAPNSDKVLEVTEKIRISNLCSNGLYHFRSTELFFSLYAGIEALDPATLQGGEYYIAPLYNTAVKRGLDIRYRLVPVMANRFCGTPDEYEALRAQAAFAPIGLGA